MMLLETMEKEMTTYSTDEYVNFDFNYKVSDWLKLAAELANLSNEKKEKNQSTYIFDYAIERIKYLLEIKNEQFENYRKSF